MTVADDRLGPQSEAGTAEPATLPAVPVAGGRKRRRWLKGVAIAFLLVAVLIPILSAATYRFVPPPVTYLMIERLAQGYGLHKRWRPLSAISPALPQAVIAAEDAKFCEHHGFDIDAIRQAMRANQRRPNQVRGGSTISQQTAKNVFLWNGRSYLRKGLEAYFTLLIEALWGKRRILEVYLNVAEWGPGTYGAEAAAQRYFKVSAAKLNREQAARLAAILPSPLRWKAVQPGPYVARRSRRIGAAAVTVREADLAACVRR
ncbi:MAG TPA: monofunctional biosynthetic peptidoglycan transglycosylase [Caulobacteraceae bacterium]|jgi:monofunctional biosynthetic peptidoglycan transglycosylase|nr:monofunctional biosynthetic peptidoglycan transglycosylase [Caulobacteraceae bacterium]